MSYSCSSCCVKTTSLSLNLCAEIKESKGSLLYSAYFMNYSVSGAQIWHALTRDHTVLANMTFTFAICCRPSVWSVCLSVICNVRAPYSGGLNFRQYFFGIMYLGHFTEIVPGEPQTPTPGELNTRGVAKYSDFGPIDGYISETVQDRR